MPPQTYPLVFKRDFDPRYGEPVSVADSLTRVVARNAGAFTFMGTDSYLVGHDRLLVVDPGPRRDDHHAALVAAIAGRPVEALVLTHTHADHCDGAERLAKTLKAPVWFAGWHEPGRAKLIADRTLVDGERLTVDGVTLEAIATPGHCDNHLAFGLVGTPNLLSGDHVMGWSSTVLAPQKGSLARYLASLDRVIAAPYDAYWPGHGDGIADGRAFAQGLKAHRLARNEQIIDAIAGGRSRTLDILRAVYPDLALPLWPAARMTLTAHLDHLTNEQRIVRRVGLLGTRYAIAD
jgi:glyoxylase-like metal-dependent hydrolase (beta-lactamase superfamily II)